VVSATTTLPGSVEEITASDASLRAFLHGLPGVDQVGAQGRAADLATRSIKTTAKAFAIDLAMRMIDLTTLEGADTPGKVRALCTKAMHRRSGRHRQGVPRRFRDPRRGGGDRLPLRPGEPAGETGRHR
jgi:hypothetical protein